MNFEGARRQYEAIRELMVHHPGGWQDDDSLRRLRTACLATAVAVDDEECRRCLATIDDCAKDLFSADGHTKWARTHLKGADVLRLQILRELDVFMSRLSGLELIYGGSVERFVPRRHDDRG